MQKFTLRFENPQLEKKYRQDMLEQARQFFQLTQICLMVCLAGLVIYSAIMKKGDRNMLQFSGALAIVMISYVLGYRYNSNCIPHILMFENLVFTIIQIYYVKVINQETNIQNSFYNKPHESFMAGTFISLMHVSLIIGPDFVENTVHIAVIFLVKTSIGLIDARVVVAFLMPIGGLILIYSLYCKHRITRRNYLGMQIEKDRDFIFDKGFSEYYFKCYIDKQNNSLKIIQTNEKIRQRFYDVNLFIRQLMVNKQETLELFIWNAGIQINNNDEQGETQFFMSLDCKLPRDNGEQTYNVKIFVNWIRRVEFTVIINQVFSNNKLKSEIEIKNLKKTIQHLSNFNRRQVSLLCALRKQEIGIKSLKKISLNLYSYASFIQTHLVEKRSRLIVSLVPLKSIKGLLKKTQRFIAENKCFIAIKGDPQWKFASNLAFVIHVHLILVNYMSRKFSSNIEVRLIPHDHEGEQKKLHLEYSHPSYQIERDDEEYLNLLNKLEASLKFIGQRNSLSKYQELGKTLIKFTLLDFSQLVELET